MTPPGQERRRGVGNDRPGFEPFSAAGLFVRPPAGFRILLWVWAVLAAGMLALTAAMILLPEATRPIERFVPHRKNLEAAEWKAAARVASQVRPGIPVVVDTDNPIFLYILRHSLYPTWVVPDGREGLLEHAPPGSLMVRTGFRAGALQIREVDRR